MQMVLEPLLAIKNSTFRDLIEKMQRFYIARFKKMANSFMDIFLLMTRDIRNYNTVRHCTSLTRFLGDF